MSDLVTWRSKQATAATGQARSLFFDITSSVRFTIFLSQLWELLLNYILYTNREIILHDVFVQLQSIFNSTNINHGQSYPICGFWLKYYIINWSIIHNITFIVNNITSNWLFIFITCRKSKFFIAKLFTSTLTYKKGSIKKYYILGIL